MLNVRPTLALIGSFCFLICGCPSDEVQDHHRDTTRPDASDASRDSSYDPPVIHAIDPIQIEPGESTSLSLPSVITDPDTPFEHLIISVTDGSHVTGRVDGELLIISAPSNFSGNDRLVLRAEDPTGLWDEGHIEVVVQDPVPAPARDCRTYLSWNTTYGAASTVAFASEANSWRTDTHLLVDENDTGVFELGLELPEGAYGYKLVLNGNDWRMDPTNPHLVEVDGILNSLLLVPACQGPDLEIANIVSSSLGTASWQIDVFDSPSQPGIDLSSLEVTINWQPVESRHISASSSRVTISLDGLDHDKYTLRASIANLDGQRSETLFAPLWIEDEHFDWRDAVIYFAFVDRFRNGRTDNDFPRPETSREIVNWMGGDYAGIIEAIEEGFFCDLGVNTIWISAPNENPDEAMDGEAITEGFVPRVSAYHAYFPKAARRVENHFGTLEELRALSRAAHRRGIRIMVDFVANHVYETHPYYTEGSPDDFHMPPVVCREDNWQSLITCWFEPYLPDLNYGRREIIERTVADALWWIDAADLDGFRLDAVKHMQHNFSYFLRARVDRMMEPSGLDFCMIGETFTGDWDYDRTGALEELAEFISPALLSGQFNFPIYWEIVRTLARRESGFESFFKLDAVIQASEARFDEHDIMGTFLGNHDVVRFVSHANGDISDMWGNGSKYQAYFEPPAQPSNDRPYRQLRLAMGLILTIPGVPTLYYGDEIGLAGAGDPDNRRFYPWNDPLNSAQLELLETVQQLGQFRAERVEMRRGGRHTLANDSVYVYARTAGSSVSVVAINNALQPESADVVVADWLSNGTVLTDLLSGQQLTVNNGRLNISLPPLEMAIYSTP